MRVGNPLFLQLIEPLWQGLGNLWDKPLGKTTVGHSTLPLHRELVRAIAQGDAEVARKTVEELVARVEGDLCAEFKHTQRRS